jgi:tRNA A-37 threonylcarbamoyl transferase component Bud32
MRAPLTDAELDARLAVLGLVRDTTVVSPPPSKNRTVVCRGGKKRVLVKIADGPGNVGVLREGSVLERVAPLSLAPKSPLHLPHVYAFDPAHGLLALDWILNGETLHHYHRRSQEYPHVLARQVGHALGYLHSMSRAARARYALADTFRDESDLLECFMRMRPDFYARLSNVGIEFFAQVQSDNPAMQGLKALSEQQLRDADGSLLHGDLRQANLLRVARTGKAPYIVFLDWELSFWGDPARDLGSLLSDYLLGWLAPEHRSEVLSRSVLSGFCGALLAGYPGGREAGFAPDPGFQERVVRWIGAALLIYVYGISHYDQALDARALGVTRHALDMLGRPSDWSSLLWSGIS